MKMMIGEATTVVGDNRRAMRSAGPRILAYVFPTHTQESNTMTRCYRRGIKTLEKKKHVNQDTYTYMSIEIFRKLIKMLFLFC